MPIFPARFRHERGEGILPRAENHSSAEMGMSGDVHLFVDEASGAHSPNLEKAARAVWRGAKNWWPRRLHISVNGANRRKFGKRIAPLCARLSREKCVGYGPAN